MTSSNLSVEGAQDISDEVRWLGADVHDVEEEKTS